MERMQFGVERPKSCRCGGCVGFCRKMPGMVIPSDLKRMMPPFQCNRCYRAMEGTTACDGACACGGLIQNTDPLKWAERYLRASPGAIVMKDGMMFRIPTLVPAKLEGGCIYLSEEGACTINDAAPFGCAFFGHNQPTKNEYLSAEGLKAVFHNQQLEGSLYWTLWVHLHSRSLTAEGPEVLRFEK